MATKNISLVNPSVIKTCRAKDPSTCRYHGAVIKMAAAIKENNPQKYLEAKAEAEKYLEVEERRGWFKKKPTTVNEEEKMYREKILDIIDERHSLKQEKLYDKKFAANQEINKVYTNGKKRQVKFSAPWGGSWDVADVSDLSSTEDIQKLVDIDPRLRFQNGDCGVLANELWSHNPHVEEYYYFKTKDEPDFGIHQFVKLKDGTYADSLGIWSEEHLTATWKKIDPTVELKIMPGDEAKDSKTPIAYPKLFNAITEIIDAHMSNTKK